MADYNDNHKGLALRSITSSKLTNTWHKSTEPPGLDPDCLLRMRLPTCLDMSAPLSSEADTFTIEWPPSWNAHPGA